MIELVVFGSFGRELLGRYLRTPGARPYNFDPIVRWTLKPGARACGRLRWKSIRRSGNNDWWARFNDRVQLECETAGPGSQKGVVYKGCDLRCATVTQSRLRSRRKWQKSGSVRPRGVSRDNALIKCHESAPLCASAAWIYKYAWRQPPFASPVNTPAWAPMATFNSAICTESNDTTRCMNSSVF